MSDVKENNWENFGLLLVSICDAKIRQTLMDHDFSRTADPGGTCFITRLPIWRSLNFGFLSYLCLRSFCTFRLKGSWILPWALKTLLTIESPSLQHKEKQLDYCESVHYMHVYGNYLVLTSSGLSPPICGEGVLKREKRQI